MESHGSRVVGRGSMVGNKMGARPRTQAKVGSGQCVETTDKF